MGFLKSFDDEEEFYEEDAQIVPHLTIVDTGPRPSEWTGVLDKDGNKIVRVYVEMHPVGFLAPVGDFAPFEDFFYDVQMQLDPEK